MQFEECLQFLQRIGIHADFHYVESLFGRLSEDESNVLEFDEFQKVIIIIIIRRRVIIILISCFFAVHDGPFSTRGFVSAV